MAENPTQSDAFRWVHSFLAYGLSFVTLFYAPGQSAIVCIGAFTFSAVMCRAATAKDLAPLINKADDILKRRKPRQGRLSLGEHDDDN